MTSTVLGTKISPSEQESIVVIEPVIQNSMAEAAPAAAGEPGSYQQILKSSALIGGSQFLNIAFGIIRTKAMAILLGPAGFGLFGLYGSITNLTQTIGGMGVNSSGVRQIAEAMGTGRADRVAVTTAALRRISLVLGALGAALLLVFARQVSYVTFGTSTHAGAVRLLSLAVLLQLISAGQGALIQGMRRIADLAKMGTIGAFCGILISVPIVYWLHENGVVLSLVAVAAVSVIASWWYSRKIRISVPNLNLSEIVQEAGALLKLGFAFMSSGLMTIGVAYLVRIVVLRKVGFEGTGYYQSAWTLGGLYVGFILQAMAADFYPRLTASIHDNVMCNRLVNEQTQVGLLLAAPGVIGTLTFAPIVISLLYSAKFGAAAGILRWICLGTTMQVITWPMGFIIVAQARQVIFFLCELAWTIVSVCLAWLCVKTFGLNGAGIAFFLSYVFHLFLIYPTVRHISDFRWSAANKRTGLFLLPQIAVVFCAFYVLPLKWAACIGSAGVLISCVYSLRTLSRLVPVNEIPRPVRRLLTAMGVLQSYPGIAG
jgi:enterobacterial common antigen flippase